MIEIVLVRHGQTEGNKVHRFIGGRTDEPVTEEGLAMLAGRVYPKVEHVYTSPMLRCIQTAGIVFPGVPADNVEGFRECDFGILEGKTHRELEGNPVYDAFLKAEKPDVFPEGEAISDFNARCLKALVSVVERSREKGYKTIGCCVHGGVIMAVLSQIIEGSSYYGWNVKNAEGYILQVDERKWKEGQLDGTVTGGIMHRIYT